MLEIEGSEGGSDRRYLFAEGFHRSTGSARANSSTTCRISAGTLESSGNLTVRVLPRNSFGTAGAAISAVAIPSGSTAQGLPDAFVEWIESNGTQYIDTGVAGREGGALRLCIWNHILFAGGG